MKQTKLLRQIRKQLLLFMLLLFISGATAIPVAEELRLVIKVVPADTWANWLLEVQKGFIAMQSNYPFLMYGYDWLAFAHFVLAILFIGPYRNPVKNIWVIQFGLIACFLILPFAFVTGHFRSIPFWWQLIDCSFGVFGAALLWIIYTKTKSLTI